MVSGVVFAVVGCDAVFLLLWCLERFGSDGDVEPGGELDL